MTRPRRGKQYTGYIPDIMEEAMSKAITAGEREKHMAEDIWLNYFNRYLSESGTISENEFRKMTEKIAARTARHTPGRNTG